MKIRCTLTCTLLLAAGAAVAQAPSTLPVKQVTLFTSGVAYTERAGAVDGDAAVPLTFRTAQINDILKSMVLIDVGGKVQPATYASRDPIGRSLQAFAVDVIQNSNRQEVLGSLRGVRISVSSAGKPQVEGQIIGIEQKQVAASDGKAITAAYISLLTNDGIVSIALDADKTVKILDPRLEKELHDALTLLATGTDDQRRSVMLHFAGAGKRDVRVGYVMEAPIWKMSYRLLVGGTAKPYIQGWALVENTTDEDWNNVILSLVSGRPVSFIQDLYQPLYIPRPVVGPDIVASPYPQTHDEALYTLSQPAIGPGGAGGARFNYAPTYSGAIGGNGRGGRPGPAGPMGEKGDAGPAGAPGPSGDAGFTTQLFNGVAGDASRALRDSVLGLAQGEKAGELFQYAIDTPVSLPRQQAAMIPVISKDIETEKLSLYNASTGPKYPMNAIRIHNTTNLHLKGGPVTLFDDGVYAGDARMEDVPPGDSRLITYAVDLSLVCERQNPTATSNDTTVSIKRGVMTLRRREVMETTYTIKSKADKPRVVLVEHPFDSAFKLDSPAEPEERTASLYRFKVTVKPGDSQTLKVVTERPLAQDYAVMDGDINLLVVTSNRGDISPKLKSALQEVIRRRRHADELKASADARAAEITSIGEDQDRIRKNMEALDKSSTLYKRYVGELDTQETKLDSLRQETAKLKADAAAAAVELKADVDGIEE